MIDKDLFIKEIKSTCTILKQNLVIIDTIKSIIDSSNNNEQILNEINIDIGKLNDSVNAIESSITQINKDIDNNTINITGLIGEVNRLNDVVTAIANDLQNLLETVGGNSYEISNLKELTRIINSSSSDLTKLSLYGLSGKALIGNRNISNGTGLEVTSAGHINIYENGVRVFDGTNKTIRGMTIEGYDPTMPTLYCHHIRIGDFSITQGLINSDPTPYDSYEKLTQALKKAGYTINITVGEEFSTLYTFGEANIFPIRFREYVGGPIDYNIGLVVSSDNVLLSVDNSGNAYNMSRSINQTRYEVYDLVSNL